MNLNIESRHACPAGIGQISSPVLRLNMIQWPNSKVCLNDVLKGNAEPIQVDENGDLVSGAMNVLKYKANEPQAEFVEVSVAEGAELPPTSDYLIAA
jgi:hypothetical protein